MNMKWKLFTLLGLSFTVSHCSIQDRDFSTFGDGDGALGGTGGDGDGDGDGNGDGDGDGDGGDGDGDLGGAGGESNETGGESNGTGGEIIVPVDCSEDACPSAQPFCDDTTQMCRGCETHDECLGLDAATPHCVDASCVACVMDDECSADTPVCGADGSCRRCESDDECGSMACSSDGTCVAEDNSVYALAQTGLTTNCGTKDAPCRFLDDAAALLSSDRPNLVLLPTPQSFTNYSIVLSAGLDVVIYGNDVRINGSATPVISTTGGSVVLNDVRIEGFDDAMQTLVSCIDGSMTVRDSHFSHSGVAVEAIDCELEVSTSTFDTLGYGVSSYCNVADPCTPGFHVERSLFQEIPGGAIGTYAEDGRIENNIFSNVGEEDYGRGLEIRADRTFIGFNTLYRSGNCDYTGLVCCLAADLVVTSNITFENTLDEDPNGNCYDQVYYSCADVNYALSEAPLPGGTGNQWGDPMLVDPVNGDFHLMSGSDAIDAGDASNAPAVDFYGNPRNVGAGPDVGAVEYQ